MRDRINQVHALRDVQLGGPFHQCPNVPGISVSHHNQIEFGQRRQRLKQCLETSTEGNASHVEQYLLIASPRDSVSRPT